MAGMLYNCVFLILFCNILVGDGEAVSSPSTEAPLTIDSTELMNTSIACTRGVTTTLISMSCRDNATPLGLLAVKRLFYGAVPITNNCNGLEPPYENCCQLEANKDYCIFESDFGLDKVTKACSGKASCRLYGTNTMSGRGGCDGSVFNSITSFVFAEYQCIATKDLNNMCPSSITERSGIELQLNSNYEHTNSHLDAGVFCTCVVSTRCGAQVVIDAETMQLRRMVSSGCVEEILLQDLKNTSIDARFTCKDHSVNGALNNHRLFKSESNVAVVKLIIFDTHTGKLILSVRSSDANSTVQMKCGQNLKEENFRNDYSCQDDPDIPEIAPQTTSPTTQEVKSTKQEVNPTTSQKLEDTTVEGGTVIIQHQTESLRAGDIAGIVLACLGILLVIFQGLFCLWRRQVKKRDVRTEDGNMSEGTAVGFGNDGVHFGNNGSISTISSHANGSVIVNDNNNDNVDDDPGHVYDLAMEAVGESTKSDLYYDLEDDDQVSIVNRGADKMATEYDNHLYDYAGDYSIPPSYHSNDS